MCVSMGLAVFGCAGALSTKVELRMREAWSLLTAPTDEKVVSSGRLSTALRVTGKAMVRSFLDNISGEAYRLRALLPATYSALAGLQY